MIDLGHWRLGENIQLPEDFENNIPVGFVYQVCDKTTGKFYIGQKKIIKTETRPPLKRKGKKTKSNQGNGLEELLRQL